MVIIVCTEHGFRLRFGIYHFSAVPISRVWFFTILNSILINDTLASLYIVIHLISVVHQNS